jgi:hypothetical protein
VPPPEPVPPEPVPPEPVSREAAAAASVRARPLRLVLLRRAGGRAGERGSSGADLAASLLAAQRAIEV